MREISGYLPPTNEPKNTNEKAQLSYSEVAKVTQMVAMSSLILYAAPLWILALDIKSYAKSITTMHRLCTEAADVFVSMRLIDIQREELEPFYQLNTKKKLKTPGDSFMVGNLTTYVSVH